MCIVAVALVLTGCAGPNPLVGTAGARGVAGFWAGLWHGMIVVITFVISLFNRNVHIYEVHNNGVWYNLGFVLGAMISLGGGGRGSRRK
jgi:hypothetical protein